MTTWTYRYYRHTLCSNEPEHLQGFPDGPNGPGSPQAGVRCEGCGGPTAVYDWAEVVNDVNVCDRCTMPVVEIDAAWQHSEVADAAFCALVFGGAK